MTPGTWNVPQFHGYTLSLDLDAFTPRLDASKRYTGVPSAVLLKCLPNPLVMNSVTYSDERMDKALSTVSGRSINPDWANIPCSKEYSSRSWWTGKCHTDRLTLWLLIIPTRWKGATAVGDGNRDCWGLQDIPCCCLINLHFLLALTGLDSRRSENTSPTRYKVLLRWRLPSPPMGTIRDMQGAQKRTHNLNNAMHNIEPL